MPKKSNTNILSEALIEVLFSELKRRKVHTPKQYAKSIIEDSEMTIRDIAITHYGEE